MPHFVLRIPLEDSSAAESTVLVNVQTPAKEGGDIVIEGTEGETPYVASFSPKALTAARSSSSPIPASAWKETLAHLLQHGPPPPLPNPAPTLSLTASLDASNSLTLHLRQTLAGGISQRLGELKLNADADHEIDTLAWTATAVARSTQLSVERDTAVQRAKHAEQRAQALSDQLEELVQARKGNEDAMLVAFADLLNEKKRKVRELQRCVEELRITDGGDGKEATKADTKKESKASTATKGRKAGASRTGKRKAEPVAEAEAEADGPMEQDDADGSIEDEQEAHDSSDFEQMRSPGAERDDESTDAGSENDEAPEPAAQLPPKRGVGKIGGKVSDESGIQTKDKAGGEKATGKAASKAKKVDPPPRRELPFTRQQEAKQGKGVDEGAETSDDEL